MELAGEAFKSPSHVICRAMPINFYSPLDIYPLM